MDNKTVIIALAVIGTLTAGFLLFGGSKPSQPDVTPVTPDVAPDALKDMYNEWKLNFNINVGASEDEYRFGVFAANVDKINKHNALNKSYTLGLNAFTHLTQEEFSSTRLGFKVPAPGPRHTVRLPLKNVGTNVDWTTKMNGVKDQGQCGSCWAFSTVGAIEGAHSAQKGNLFDLSEQELVDCSGSFGNQGCNGGLMDQGFQYVQSVGGLATEDAYPYTAVDGTCQTVSQRSGAITGFADVTPNSAAALKAAIAKAPVSVAIEADTFTFQGYSSGVITDFAGCGDSLDHGVVAVGFNDEASTPFYKVRNSWGASWGEAGHVRLAIIDDSVNSGHGMCGIQMMASYPTI